MSTFGITSRVDNVHRGGRSTFSYTSRDGEERIYRRRPSYDLRITGASMSTYAAHIGFGLSRKAGILAESIESRKNGFYATDTSVRLTDRVDEGIELTYNLSEPDVGRGTALLGAYSLGLAVPFVLSAIAVPQFLALFQRMRSRIAVVSRVSGMLLVAVGVLMLTNYMATITSVLQAYTPKGLYERL